MASPLMIAESGSNGRKKFHSLFNNCVAVICFEDHSDKANLDVRDNVKQHENSAFFCEIGTHELRSIPLTKIGGNCFVLRNLDITIDHVRKVGEFEDTLIFESLFGRGPVFKGVLLVLEIDTRIVEDVTVDVTAGASSDGPVSKYKA